MLAEESGMLGGEASRRRAWGAGSGNSSGYGEVVGTIASRKRWTICTGSYPSSGSMCKAR